jgi:predicted secreted hydrolase
MDHQWADVPYMKDKWTWFSIQLENGTDVMCIEYDNGKKKEYLVDLLDAKGNATHYSHALFSPIGKTLKSTQTRAEYPLSWEIDVPDGDIRLEISAILSDQEMIFGAINYWEGPTKVVATIKNKKIKGVGFMELAGYPSDYNFLILEGKELNKKLNEEIKSIFK